MRRVIVLLSVAVLAAAAFAGSATAGGNSPVRHEPDLGEFTHTHHVHAGDKCIDIDSVLFVPAENGLHRGSNSSGITRGPWHGTCDNRLYPGGPLLTDVGLPPHH